MTTPAARRRHPMAALLVLLVALLTTGALYAVLAPTSTRAQAADSFGADDVDQGRELFLANCATCHGLNAEGTTDGPSLIGVGAASVHFQVGTGRMPLAAPAAQAPEKPVVFTEEQIYAMAAYVQSLAPGPAIPGEEAYDYADLDAEDIAEGGEIFRTNCAMCHNFAGAGGALTNGKYAPDLQGVEPVFIYEAMVTGPQSMPVFNDLQINPEDKQKIIAYLAAVEETPSPGLSLGEVGPVSEGVFVWIVGIGGLIACAVWLGAKSS